MNSSLGRQGEAGGFNLASVDHYQPLFCQVMIFIASCILVAAVVTCSALVYNVRSSEHSAHGMWEHSWSHMSSMKIMKRVGEMTQPCGTPLIFTLELVCPSSLTHANLWNK